MFYVFCMILLQFPFFLVSFWKGKYMKKFQQSCFADFGCNFRFIIFWMIGLFLGALLCLHIYKLGHTYLYSAQYHNGSILRILAVNFVPFFFIVVSFFLKKPWLYFCFGFYAAFLFVFTSLMWILLFPANGWLLRLLFMLPSLVTLPMCFYIHLQLARGKGSHPCRDIRSCCLYSVMVDLLYCYFFLPMLEGLNI